MAIPEPDRSCQCHRDVSPTGRKRDPCRPCSNEMTQEDLLCDECRGNDVHYHIPSGPPWTSESYDAYYKFLQDHMVESLAELKRIE